MFYTYYPNSLLASLTSVAGWVLIGSGFILGSEMGWGITIALAVCGAPLIYLASRISKNKEDKKWFKKLRDNGVEAEMRTSLELAQRVYAENPNKNTLNYIASVNPSAAEVICSQLAK